MAELSKDPSDDTAEAEAPRKQRKPIGWSMISIAVLVAISVVLVWRRDGMARHNIKALTRALGD